MPWLHDPCLCHAQLCHHVRWLRHARLLLHVRRLVYACRWHAHLTLLLHLHSTLLLLHSALRREPLLIHNKYLRE